MMTTKGKETVTFEATDTLGLIYRDGKYFKELRREGPKTIYVEVKPKEYDSRVQLLADKILKCPGVDMSIVLKDALYDLPLNQLEKMEKDILKEIELAETRGTEPNIKTRVRERGTCVSLVCGGHHAMVVRD